MTPKDILPRAALRLPIAGLVLTLTACCPAVAQQAAQAEKDFAFAEGLYGQAQYEMAAEKLALFIRQYPNHANMPLALFRAGECRFRLGKYTEAAGNFEQVTKRFPTSEEAEPAWLWLGDSWYQAREYAKAAAAYEGLLASFKETPHAGRASYWRGESLYQLGQYDAAILAYTDALGRKLGEEETAYALYSIGLCHLKLGAHDEAVDFLGRVIAQHPASATVPECRYLLGTAYHAKKDYAKAIQTFESILRAHGTSKFAPDAQLRIGWCYYEQKQYENALKAFEAVLTRHAGSSAAEESRLRMGDCQFQLKHWTEAANEYSKVVAKGGRWAPEGLYWLGITYERRKDAANAMKTFQRLVKEHKDNSRVSDAHCHLGQIHGDAGRNAEAIAAYQAAVASAKDEKRKRRASAGLQWAKYQDSKSTESLSSLATIVRADPKSQLAAELSCQVARAHFEAAQFEEALAILDGFVKNHPTHNRVPEALFLSGACHEKLGRADRAEEMYRQVLATGGKSVYVGHATSALVGLYAGQGDLDKARQMADSVGKSGAAPEVLAFASYQLGRALYKAKAYEQAASLYERALTADPEGETAPHSRLGLGWARLAAGDTAGAGAAFRECAAKDAQSELGSQIPDGLVAVAEALFDDEKYDEAEALYSIVPARFADSKLVGEAKYKLAWIQSKRDRPEQALPLFIEAAEKATSGDVVADARYQAARILIDKQDYKRVAELLEPLLAEPERFEKMPWALAILARALSELGDTAKAVGVCEKLAQQHAQHPAAAYGFLTIGKNLRGQKDFDKALSALDKALQSATGDTAAEAQFEIASCYRDKGDLQKAAEEFLKGSILYATGKWAPQAQFEAGRCFEQLKDVAKARRSYEIIVDKYAEQQPWADKARERLEALKD